MPTRNLTEALRRLMSDGTVKTLGYLHANVRHLIPPESAARKYQRQSTNPNRVPLEEQVERGEVQLIRLALTGLRATALDPYGGGWQVRYRLDRSALPWRTCPTCKLEFVTYNKRERYCGIGCLRQAMAEKQRAYRLSRRGIQTLTPRPRGRPPKRQTETG
jgi:hypothetical protein